jgi:N6-adenosine-specific RNA methylase IME4
MLAKNAAVFMWQSDSLPHATGLLAGIWGLRIVTNPVFIWKKPSIGMGYWGRKRAETVVMMVKGRPKRLSGGVDQVIEAPRREHSRKPDEIYARVEALVGGPYLEMFARQQYPGWDTWGNETAKFQVAAE